MGHVGGIALVVALGIAAPVARADTDGSLVPTRSQAQLERASRIAHDLESSIATMPGVVSVRVHISLPSEPAFAERLSEPARSSVLVHAGHLGPEVDHSAIQRLVAGAVPGLTPSSVVVVEVPASAPPKTEPKVARVGPFLVAETSATHVRSALVALLVLQALLASLLLHKIRRHRSQPAADGGR